jgi:hypothetical protein
MSGTSRSATSSLGARWAAWSAASAVDTAGGCVVYFAGAGRDCAPGRLAEAVRLTPSHDDALAAATRTINQLLDRVAAANVDAGRSLRIVLTVYGRALVWAHHDGNAQTSAATLADDPTAFARLLGNSGETLKPEPRRDWVIDEEGYLIGCRRGPDNQHAARLTGGGNLTPSHDAALAQCTEEINAILEETAGQKPGSDPNLVLALLSTPQGLFLAWTVNDDSDRPNPPGAITARSDERTISRALGLAKPVGGPPWKVIVPIGAVGAAGGAIIIAVAAGVFSGGDSSSIPAATSSPTVHATQVGVTVEPKVTATPRRETDVPSAASPTRALAPTQTPASTREPAPTSPIEPTRQPAPTRTPNVPPRT